MNFKRKHFITAIALTALDLAVTLRYGVVIWQAYSGVIWSRLLLLLLAAVWATSLANLWSRAYRELRGVARDRRFRLSPLLVAQIRPTGEQDV